MMLEENTQDPTGLSWFVWAPSKADAEAQADSYFRRTLGMQPENMPKLRIRHTGLTRPGRYEFEGNVADGVRESITPSELRFAIKLVM